LHNFEDNSWWYNERASLSLLAAAAWGVKGWGALEEYSTTKQGVVPANKVDEGQIKRGRCDLWLGNRTGYALEAKQAWQSIGARANNVNVWKALRHAWSDAGKLTVDEADKRLAAVFVSPYIAVSDILKSGSGKKPVVDRVKVCARVDDWLTTLNLKGDPRVHAFAWVFPRQCDLYLGKDNKNLFPGTVLIMSERKRSHRSSR
jgi:hypothetical protein